MTLSSIDRKPLKTGLIGIVISAALALSGIGAALASPNNEDTNDVDESVVTTSNADHQHTISIDSLKSSTNFGSQSLSLYSGKENYTRYNDGYLFSVNCDECSESFKTALIVRLVDDTTPGNCTNQGRGTGSFEVALDLNGAISSIWYDLQENDGLNDACAALPVIGNADLNYVGEATHNLDVSTKVITSTEEASFTDQTSQSYDPWNGGFWVNNPKEYSKTQCSTCGNWLQNYEGTSTATPSKIEYVWNDGNKVVVKCGMNVETYIDKDYWNDDYDQYQCTVTVTFTDGSTVSTVNPKLPDLNTIKDSWGDDADPFSWYSDEWKDKQKISWITVPLCYLDASGSAHCQTSWVYMYKTVNGTYGTLNPSISDAEEFEEAVEDGSWFDEETGESVSITLRFNATGIQATSFKDYKEAMAALNSGRN